MRRCVDSHGVESNGPCRLRWFELLFQESGAEDTSSITYNGGSEGRSEGGSSGATQAGIPRLICERSIIRGHQHLA